MAFDLLCLEDKELPELIVSPVFRHFFGCCSSSLAAGKFPVPRQTDKPAVSGQC